MKTFVALLLLLNIAVFAWFQQWLTFIPFQPADLMPAATTPPPSKLPSLVLLREQQQAVAAAEAAANTPKTVEKVAEKPADTQPTSATATPATSATQLVNASTPPVAATVAANNASSVKTPVNVNASASNLTATATTGDKSAVATTSPDKTSTSAATSTPSTAQTASASANSKSTNASTANSTNVAIATDDKTANAKVEKTEKTEKTAMTTTQTHPETAHTVFGLVGKITDRLSNAVEDLSTTSPAASDMPKKVTTANNTTTKENKEQEAKETAATEANKESTLKAANADKGQALTAKAEKNPNNEATNKTVGLESASATEKPEAAGQDKNKTAAANKSKTTNICYLAGYFEQKELADSAATWFNQQQQHSASVVQRTTEIAQGTQLYLAVFDNLEGVQKANKVLTQQGIQDHFIVQQDNQYIISLGLYKEAASLEKRQKELKAKGYPNVKAVPHYLSAVRYWLNIQLPSTQKIVIERFQKAFANITTQTVECS